MYPSHPELAQSAPTKTDGMGYVFQNVPWSRRGHALACHVIQVGQDQDCPPPSPCGRRAVSASLGNPRAAAHWPRGRALLGRVLAFRFWACPGSMRISVTLEVDRPGGVLFSLLAGGGREQALKMVALSTLGPRWQRQAQRCLRTVPGRHTTPLRSGGQLSPGCWLAPSHKHTLHGASQPSDLYFSPWFFCSCPSSLSTRAS